MLLQGVAGTRGGWFFFFIVDGRQKSCSIYNEQISNKLESS